MFNSCAILYIICKQEISISAACVRLIRFSLSRFAKCGLSVLLTHAAHNLDLDKYVSGQTAAPRLSLPLNEKP